MFVLRSIKSRETSPRTRGRRRLLLSLLILVAGTLLIVFNRYGADPSWPGRVWTTSSAPYGNVTPEGCGLSADLCFVPYPDHYHFILDQPHRCREEEPFLVLVTPVAPRDRESRDIIRRTWASERVVLGRAVAHFFLLGVTGDGNESHVQRVVQESQRHQDILQSNFVDSYNNLTIKTMLMFEWLSSRCPNATYAMKIDSDIFLNVRKLVQVLTNAPRRRYMTGQVAREAPVCRDPYSKWFLPVSVFPASVYPTYVRGLGYIFSMDLPRLILEASSQVRAVYIEDVYVGLCLRHLGIPLTHPPQSGLFRDGLPLWTFGCSWNTFIATILENSEQIEDVWGSYQRDRQNGC